MQATLNPMIPLTRIVPRTLDWLWPNRLAMGKLAMFDGDPGRGKSLVTLDMLCPRYHWPAHARRHRSRAAGSRRHHPG
jgi:hypothetical protein